MDLFLGLGLSLTAAVVPTIIYAMAFYLADRYEREPVWLGIVAFLWGAVPAIIVSLIGEILIGAPMVNAPGSLAEAVVETAVVAPLVEEFVKGLAVFAIFYFFRHEFDGVLDGLTYGALIGFGFAMTENFLYFVGAFSEGGFVDLTILIFLRSIVFGLNHAFYTGLLGIGFGMARLSHSKGQRNAWIIFGFAASVFAHAVHNFGASISVVNGVGIFLSLGMAILGVGMVLLALMLTWQQELKWLREELNEEVGILLTEQEYAALTKNWRRSDLLDRKHYGEQALRMQQLVELAFRKHRLRRLGTAREPKLTAQIQELRAQVAARIG
ncbi:PrsW family intramembrane metalloprotease [bacterium]|nr:PrsW family intramembrane metalloprotease [bacterium]